MINFINHHPSSVYFSIGSGKKTMVQNHRIGWWEHFNRKALFFFGKNHGLRCSDFPQQTNDQNMVHLRKVLRGWRPVASASYASRATWPSARRPCRRRPGAWRCRPSNRWRRSSRWISFRGQSLGPWEMWCFWWGFYGFFKGVLMGFNSSGNFTWLWKMAYIHSWFTY